MENKIYFNTTQKTKEDIMKKLKGKKFIYVDDLRDSNIIILDKYENRPLSKSQFADFMIGRNMGKEIKIYMIDKENSKLKEIKEREISNTNKNLDMDL